MTIDRRRFLQGSASALLSSLALSGPLTRLANADGKGAGAARTLVVIYMRGGMDSLGLIAPYGDPQYQALRPTIGFTAPGTEGGCLPLVNAFGLHPAMTELHELYKADQFAAIVNVGSPHPTRSHFDAQDFMEFAAPGVRSITEGWLNRYLTATNEGARKDVEVRAFAAQPLLPRALRGQYPVLALPDLGAVQSMDAFADVYGCGADGMMPGAGGERPEDRTGSIVTAGQNTIRKLRFLQDILAQAENSPIRYPNGPLGTQLRAISQVIKADCGLEVAALDYNGWDHHTKEDSGLNTMLRQVSESIGAFTRDLGPERMQNVMLVTMSEFGRTAQENGTSGTDHGHGGIMMAVGGRVKGGKVYGKWTGLAKESLYEQRDLPVHTDFRLVFTEILRDFLGFTKLEKFFPDWRAQPPSLGFIKTA